MCQRSRCARGPGVPEVRGSGVSEVQVFQRSRFFRGPGLSEVQDGQRSWMVRGPGRVGL